ncbi:MULTISPECIES: DUF883 family protein [Hyphobacterium]|uniref:DUF883 C-terminal domain-containing protein n=1 Tax=Hyphobacterium vulgare TaxID=1736751 RepID=A0ABV6ZT45_9PROT
MARQPAAKATTEDTEMADIQKDLSALRKDVNKLVEDLARLAEAEVEQGVDSTKKLARKAGKQVEQTEDRTREMIRENPFAACGIALGAGFLGALMLRR